MNTGTTKCQLIRTPRPWPVVISLLVVHAMLLAYGACVHSPTMNEPGHLAAGMSYWRFRRFELYRVNPPLVRLIAALPVLGAGCENDWQHYTDAPGTRPEFAVGEDFIAANGERSFWLFTIARWACIPLSLTGALVCFLWGRELYGTNAGLLALALWCFCPNILAHGQLITPDVGATALGLAACYTFWHWLKRPTWNQVLISGLVLGMAELTKTTLLVLFPLWPIIWALYRWPDRRTMLIGHWLREGAMLVVRLLIAVWLVNLGYLFEGSFTRLEQFQFRSHTLSGVELDQSVPVNGENRFAGTWLASLPVPLPKNYVLGIDLQKSDLEDYGQPSYLLGQRSKNGWWYYYLYALAVKVPLGTWGLIALAIFTRQRRPDLWRDECVLLLPAIAILALASSQTGLNHHLRYVLPIFPLMFIWAGRVLSVDFRRDLLAWAMLTCSIVSSMSVYPHCLSYFNEAAGGPKNGHRQLLGSNLDWGQDLLYLKQWLDEHSEARPLKLAYFGYFDPVAAGIDYTAPESLTGLDGLTPLPISPGWYAISENFVQGLRFQIYLGDGQRGWLEHDALAAFGSHCPAARAGYSINIYRIDSSSTIDAMQYGCRGAHVPIESAD